MRDWDEIMRDLAAESPEVMRHVLRRSTEEARAAGQLLLALTPESRVLDLGCGLGALAFSFARTCRQVVAVDLILEHLRWIQAYAGAAGTPNLVLACAGDSPALPFADATFDVVLLSGVLEYVGLACPGEPRAVQQAFLRDIARVLTPGGQLYLGIENRLSWRYFVGRPEEHTRLRFVALLPRGLADRLHRRRRGQPLRIYTHTLGGYRRLLAGAGLDAPRFFYPLPKYSRIATLLPLDAAGREVLLPAATFRPRPWHHRLQSGGPARRFARSFVIVAGRAPAPASLLGALIDAARARCADPALAGGRWNLDRFEVRARTGKLYLHLTAGDGTRLLGKVPLTPAARRWVRGSWEALTAVHGSPAVSAATRAVVPRALARAGVGGHEIVLEEWKPGVRLRRGGPVQARMVDAALAFLTRLHRETRERVVVDEAVYARHFAPHLEGLVRWFAPAERGPYRARVDRLDAFCRRAVLGAPVPLVLRHGDFSLTNCLFSPRTLRLATIVDWDLAEPRGLPLTDAMRILLHERARPGGDRPPRREWSLRGVPETLLDPGHRARYADYLGALELPERLFAPLAVIYWAQLVNNHHGVHRCRWDRAWREENLVGRLDRWETLLGEQL